MWNAEIKLMRTRIIEVRRLLVKTFEEQGLDKFSFIRNQHGMFSFSGLRKNHAFLLREKFGVYILDSGRICIAALNDKNLDYVANAISEVVQTEDIKTNSA